MIAPVLVLLVFGTLVFGVYFGVAHSVQQLASEAARASVAGITAAERAALARGMVDRSVASHRLLWPQDLAVLAGFEPTDPDLFTVTLTYDLRRLGLVHFARWIPVPVDNLARSATIRRGGA